MRQRVATIGLLLFLALDIVLVALALRPPRATDAATVPTTTPAATSTTGSSPTTAASPTTGGTATTGTPSAAARPAPLAVMISGLDAKVAWSATAGTCEAKGSSVSVTTDGGGRWTKASSPAAAIARVQALDNGRAFVIGAGSTCRLRQYSTTDLGQSWGAPTALSGGWARRLDDPTTVVTPNEPASRPCGGAPVVDLSRTSADQAQALCETGEVVVTDDGGTTWTSSGTAPGAVALSNRLASNRLSAYVARVVATCDGIQIARVSAGKDPVELACVEAPLPSSAGRVALSTPDEAGWLLVGNETWTADSALKVWKKA